MKTSGIPVLPCADSFSIVLADRSRTACSSLETPVLSLSLGPHVEKLKFLVAPIAYDLILGYSWLQKHNPKVDWPKRQLFLTCDYCLGHCKQEKKVWFKSPPVSEIHVVHPFTEEVPDLIVNGKTRMNTSESSLK